MEYKDNKDVIQKLLETIVKQHKFILGNYYLIEDDKKVKEQPYFYVFGNDPKHAEFQNKCTQFHFTKGYGFRGTV